MFYQKRGFCDVAIVERSFPGGIVFKQTLPTLTPPAKNCLINFDQGGTGFIIALAEKKISNCRTKLGFALTAAHVVCDYLTFKPYSRITSCSLENGAKRAAYFVDDFLTKCPQEFISQKTGSRYCLSGDIAIVIIALQNSDMIDVYPLADCVNLGEECFVAGFPKLPNDPLYATPQLSGENREKILKESKQIFCNFAGKVYSLGKIEATSNLIEVSCSTTNGMSGGPIVSQGQIVGVYVGGPPIPGQWELNQMLSEIVRDNYNELETNIKNLESYIDRYKAETFTQVLIFLEILLKWIKTGNISESDISYLRPFNIDSVDDLKLSLLSLLHSCLYLAIRCFKNKELYTVNMGVSADCEIFVQVKQKMRLFLTEEREFSTIDDLISLLI